MRYKLAKINSACRNNTSIRYLALIKIAKCRFYRNFTNYIVKCIENKKLIVIVMCLSYNLTVPFPVATEDESLMSYSIIHCHVSFLYFRLLLFGFDFKYTFY